MRERNMRNASHSDSSENSNRVLSLSKEYTIENLGYRISDWILLGFFMIAVGFFTWNLLSKPQAAELYAQISMGGEEYLYTLSEDREIILENGSAYAKIKIQNGTVRFIESSCENKLCILAGTLRTQGAVAACLPNKILLKVISLNQSSKTPGEIDA